MFPDQFQPQQHVLVPAAPQRGTCADSAVLCANGNDGGEVSGEVFGGAHGRCFELDLVKARVTDSAVYSAQRVHSAATRSTAQAKTRVTRAPAFSPLTR